MATQRELLDPMGTAIKQGMVRSVPEAPKAAPVPYRADFAPSDMTKAIRKPADEAAPEDFDAPMMTKLDEVKAKGVPHDDAIEIVRALKERGSIQEPEKPGIASELGTAFKKSAEGLGGTLAGAAEKTWEAFSEGARGIGSNVAKGVSGELSPSSAIARTLSSGVSTALAPVSGIMGQASEEAAKVLPESVKGKIGSLAQQGTEAFAALPAVQQERLRDIGAGLNIATSGLGVKYAPKIAQTAEKGFEKVATGVKEAIPSVKVAVPEGVAKAGNIGGRIKEYATRDIPLSRTAKDLGLTPTERATVENTGKTAEQFILEKNLGGLDRETQVNKLQEIADDSYNQITERLKPIQERVVSEDAQKMLQTMKEEMEASPIIKRERQPYIDKLDELYKQGDYSVSELNAIRRDFDRIVGGKLFNAKGRVTGEEDKIIAGWRKNVSNEIQDVASNHGVNVQQMNNDLRNSITIRDGVLRRLSQENKNNALGLQDIGVGAILSGGDPVAATALIIAKKSLEKASPGIAQKLYNLNKSPYVPRNLRRGPVVSPRDTTGGLSVPTVPNGMGNANRRVMPALPPASGKTQGSFVPVKGRMSDAEIIERSKAELKQGGKAIATPKNPIKGSIFDLSDKRGSFKVGTGKTERSTNKSDALVEDAKKYKSAE